MEDSESKDKIMKGAMELFMKYGIRSVSMDDIARHLAISKKTIYQYFADKEDVVTTCATHHMEETRQEYQKLVDKSRNAIEELVYISRLMKNEMQEINPSLLFDLQKYHPNAWAVWLEHKNVHIRESVARNLKQGIEDGHFRQDIDPEILAVLRIEQVQTAFDDRVFPHGRFNLARVQEQIFDHFVSGLLTEKGRRLYEKYKLELKEQELITIPKHD